MTIFFLILLVIRLVVRLLNESHEFETTKKVLNEEQ